MRSNPPSPASPGLRAGLVWTVLGQGLFAAAQWLMVIVLARSGGASEVGLYSLGLALTAPLFLLLGLQLRGVQATDARREWDFAAYFSLRLPAMLLGLLLSAGLAWAYPQASGVIWWLAAAKALEGFSDVIYGLMQQRSQLDWIAQSTLLRGLLALAALTAIYLSTHSLTLATLGVAGAALVTLLLFDLPRARRLNAGRWWPAPLDRGLLRLALPLGAVIALVSLGTNLPRLMVERELGSAGLGVYAALTYVSVAGSVLVAALGTALTTRLSQLFAAGEQRAFWQLGGKLLAGAGAVGLGLSLLAGLAGGPLLGLLYGPEYTEHRLAFFWLTLAGTVTYLASALGFAVTAARRFREQLPLFVGVTALLALACWLLIPRYGLLGAAGATALGGLTQLTGSWLIVRQAMLHPPPPSEALSTPPPTSPPPSHAAAPDNIP